MPKANIFIISIIFVILNANSVCGADQIFLKYSITPDFNYSLQDIRNKNEVLFHKNDTVILPQKHKKYWAQIIVNNSHEQRYLLGANPNINNVWYYQSDDGQWKSYPTGLKVVSDRRDHFLLLSDKNIKEDTLYVHLDVSDLLSLSSFKPSFRVRKKENVDQKDWYITLFSSISIFILCMFILNNLVEYFFLREVTHVYYILGLIGGLMYVMSYHSVIESWMTFRYIKILGASETQLYIADFSYVLNRISIITIFYSLIMLASSFLNTRVYLPYWHKILQNFALIFVSFNVLSLLCTIYTDFPCDLYIITVSNILLVLAIVLIIIVGFISIKKDRKNAILFLSGHLIPFFFIVLTSIYVELNYFTTISSVMMPYLTMLSLPLGLNTLLTLRVIHIKNTLYENDLSTQKLIFENEKVKHDREKTYFEKENLKTQLEVEMLNKEILELKINLQDRQLLTSSLQIQKKNEILNQISKEVSKVPQLKEHNTAPSLKAIHLLIKNHENADNSWAIFKEHFEKIHPNFLESLKNDHPELTPNDIRLSAYLKLNLTNKEIAVLQNIEPTSVKRAKIRLKQKLGKL